MLGNNFINDATSNRFNQMALKTLLSDPQMHALLNKASITFFNKPLDQLTYNDQQNLLLVSGFVRANIPSANDPVAGFSALNQTLGLMPIGVMERARSHSVFGMGNITMGAANQIQTQLAASRSFADGAYNPIRTHGLGMGTIGGMAAQYLRLNGTQSGDIREIAMQRTSDNLQKQLEIMLESDVIGKNSVQYKELERTRAAMKAREAVSNKLAEQLGVTDDLQFRIEHERKITEHLETLRTGGTVNFGGKQMKASDLGIENIAKISGADIEAAAKMQKGTNGTFVTKQLSNRLDEAISNVSDVVADLEGMLHTKSFDELQTQLRELGIGSITSKREAQRAREMVEHIEQTALTTGRTKEQVAKEFGTIAEMDAALNGGRVSTTRVMGMQRVYDTAMLQEGTSVYTGSEVVETAARSTMNAQQQIQEVLFADYAFKQLGDNATAEQRATYESLMNQLKDIKNLPPNQRKAAIGKLLPQFKAAGQSFGGNWDDEKYRAQAANNSDIDALAEYSVGVHMLNNVNIGIEAEGRKHAGIMSGDRLSKDAENAGRILAEAFGGNTDFRNAAMAELGDIKRATGEDREAKLKAFRDKYGEALGENDVEALLDANDNLDYASLMYINNVVDSTSQVHATKGRYAEFNEKRQIAAKLAADLASAKTKQGKDLLTNITEGFLKTGNITVEQGARKVNAGAAGKERSLGALDENGNLDMDTISSNAKLAAMLGGFDISTEEGRLGWNEYLKKNNIEDGGIAALNSLLGKNGMLLSVNDDGNLAFATKKEAEDAATEMQNKLRTANFDIASQIFGEDNLVFDQTENGELLLRNIRYKDKAGNTQDYAASGDGTTLNVEDAIKKLGSKSPEIADAVLKYAADHPDDKRFSKVASDEYKRRLRKAVGKGNLTDEQKKLLEEGNIMTAEQFSEQMKKAGAAIAGSDDRDIIDATLSKKFVTVNDDDQVIANANFGKWKKGDVIGTTKWYKSGDTISDEEIEKLNADYEKKASKVLDGLRAADASGAAKPASEAEGAVNYTDDLQGIGKKLLSILEEVQRISSNR